MYLTPRDRQALEASGAVRLAVPCFDHSTVGELCEKLCSFGWAGAAFTRSKAEVPAETRLDALFDQDPIYLRVGDETFPLNAGYALRNTYNGTGRAFREHPRRLELEAQCAVVGGFAGIFGGMVRSLFRN